MNDNYPQFQHVDALLAEDHSVTRFQFEEFRMNLQQSIHQLEQRAQRIRRASLVGLALFLTMVLAMIPLSQLEILNSSWIRIFVSGTGIAAMFVTGILAGIYQYKYQPALSRANNDLLSATITQLQHQMRELQEQVVDLKGRLSE